MNDTEQLSQSLIRALKTAERLIGDFRFSRPAKSTPDELVTLLNRAQSSSIELFRYLETKKPTKTKKSKPKKNKGKKDKKKKGKSK